MALRVLTWNLFHGRALPPRNADLLEELAVRIADLAWDVALLQEAPPWWPAHLAAAAGAQERHVLTSRNGLLPLRRALARRWPELMKSNGGGCDAILVRGEIEAHAWRRVRWWPERRMVHAVRDGEGLWIANVHASTHPPRARGDLARARAAVLRWAEGAPEIVFGGDFNAVHPRIEGFAHAGGHHVDHVFARGLAPVGDTEVLERDGLSDHAPLRVTLEA